MPLALAAGRLMASGMPCRYATRVGGQQHVQGLRGATGLIKGMTTRSAWTQRAHPSRSFAVVTALHPGEEMRRAFVQYQVYKGKAAMALGPIRPTWRRLKDGGMAVDRQGTMLLEFAPAAGERIYDWNKKLTFAMNPTEIGTILAMMNQKVEFFHDPRKGTRDEGMTQKTLRVEPMPNGDGHFFSISVNDRINNIKSSLSIPVSIGEGAVIRRIFEYSIPFLIGIDEVFNMSPQVQTSDQQYPPMAVAATPFASGPPLEDAALETQGPQWHQYGENVSAQGPLDFTRLLEKEDERDYDYQPSPDSADYQPTPSFSQGVMTGQGSDAFGSRPPF